MDGTRVDLLEGLEAWRKDAEERVFWLNGMAGTGKSAITRSFCQMLGEELGGSFFCSRGTLRDDVKRIIPTLAMSLAQRNATYKLALLKVLREDPDAAHKKLELQLENLLEKPLRNAFGDSPPTLVLAIDALDECSDDEATGRMLSALVSMSPRIPIKFFITSRPEQHIRAKLERARPGVGLIRLHDIEKDVVQADISRYLAKRLQDIRSEKETSDPNYSFPPDWPSPTEVASIARRADNLFIYAFTVLEFIKRSPVSRFRMFTGSDVTAGQPLAKSIDAMYALVLSKALDPAEHVEDEISMTKRILAVILTIREPLCVKALGELMGISAEHIRDMLDPLHAVVKVPPQNDSGVVSTFHASFGDYLTNRERAKTLFIDPSDGHRDLARACVKTMALELLFNVSGCRTSYLPNSEQGLAPIPAHLTYSCLYWPHHIAVQPNPSLLARGIEVYEEKFLFWLEVLSAIGSANAASSFVRRVLTAEVTVSHDVQ